MIDKIRLIVEDANVPENMNGLFTFYKGKNKKNEVKIYKCFLEFEEHSEINNILVEDLEDEEQESVLKQYRINLTWFENKKLGKTRLRIDGNLRKWYYGINSSRDLSKKAFIDCIKILAEKIEMEENKLWNAKVTKLETGVTLKLKKKHRGIVNCIFDYKAFHKNTFGETGVEFKSENYDVIFYDHLRRVYNQKEKLERTYKKLAKNNFLFRYEIQSHKVSGTDMFKGKLDTLLRLKSNWKYIGENLLKTLNTVTFVNIVSPEIYSGIKGGTKKQMSKYLIYKGIKSIGIENFRILVEQMNPKKRSKYKKDFLNLYEQFLDIEKENYEVIFTQKVTGKIQSLN